MVKRFFGLIEDPRGLGAPFLLKVKKLFYHLSYRLSYSGAIQVLAEFPCGCLPPDVSVFLSIEKPEKPVYRKTYNPG
ncbi:MAG: hypothetical protein KAU14_06285 [Thermoplasmata archaeon]|nr:hypothetical protein [Thermoplasmata archaeon]